MTTAPTRRRWRWPFAVAALLGLTTGVWAWLRPDPPLTVETTQVERGEVKELVPAAAAGEVRSARRVTVRAEIQGTVAEVKKAKGERVTAKELVVRFDAAELNARFDQARANEEAALVAVSLAETRQRTAARALERAKKLKASEAISAVELERVETDAEAAAQAVAQAKAAAKQASAALAMAQVTKNRALLEAPFAGVLQDAIAEVGVQVAPGAPVFDLLDDSSVVVEVPVDEADAQRIVLDQTVLLYPGGRRERPVLGRVSFIPPALGKSAPEGLASAGIPQRDRVLMVEVTPEDGVCVSAGRSACSGLVVGASVNAEFLVSAKSDVLYVPTQVVLGRGRERAVFVIKDGKARRVTFEAGLTSWERTEVKAGLSPGEVLVSSLDQKGLEDGVRVAAKPPAQQVAGPLAP